MFLEDPPPAASSPADPWVSLAAAVRARGGRWCNVTDEVKPLVPGEERDNTDPFYVSLAAALERGAFPGFSPAGEFEARARGHQVWLRHRP